MSNFMVNTVSDTQRQGVTPINFSNEKQKPLTEEAAQTNKNTIPEQNLKAEEPLAERAVEEAEKKELESAIQLISEFMNQTTKNVNFLIDEDIDKLVIRVEDASSNELIKQFPSDKIIEMAKKIKGLQQEIGEKTGILIDSKV